MNIIKETTDEYIFVTGIKVSFVVFHVRSFEILPFMLVFVLMFVFV